MEDDETTIPSVEDQEQAYADESGDYSDYQGENQEEAQFGSYPEHQKEGIFAFFRHLLGLKDSSKVAYLDKRELGMLDFSVRNCEYLANLGKLLHNKSYYDFFMVKAEITLATSMSKKGWLPELVVSQKKFTQRSVQSAKPAGAPGFLSSFKKKPEPAPQQ